MQKLKILLLGDNNVGKTSFIRRWMRDEFSTCVEATIGVDFGIKKISLDGRDIKIIMWDTCGQFRVCSRLNTPFEDIQGCIFIFDVTCEESLDNILKWKKLLDKKTTSCPKCFLLGTKIDKLNNKSIENIIQRPEYNNITFDYSEFISTKIPSEGHDINSLIKKFAHNILYED